MSIALTEQEQAQVHDRIAATEQMLDAMTSAPKANAPSTIHGEEPTEPTFRF